jgi:DNA mismatch repair protein MutH
MVERVDERLVGHAIDEGVDDIGVGDVEELTALLGKTLDILPKGLIGPLPTVAEIP